MWAARKRRIKKDLRRNKERTKIQGGSQITSPNQNSYIKLVIDGTRSASKPKSSSKQEKLYPIHKLT